MFVLLFDAADTENDLQVRFATHRSEFIQQEPLGRISCTKCPFSRVWVQSQRFVSLNCAASVEHPPVSTDRTLAELMLTDNR